MNSINKKNYEELINLLEDLIETIEIMRKAETDYSLVQNENEAKEWLIFLNGHIDNEELKSLENEISDRFFGKFDVQIGTSELDNKRTKLMKKYILKSNEYLK